MIMVNCITGNSTKKEKIKKYEFRMIVELLLNI